MISVFDDTIWETGCGHVAYIPEGTPRENDMNFCWYCGKRLEEVKPEYE